MDTFNMSDLKLINKMKKRSEQVKQIVGLDINIRFNTKASLKDGGYMGIYDGELKRKFGYTQEEFFKQLHIGITFDAHRRSGQNCFNYIARQFKEYGIRCTTGTIFLWVLLHEMGHYHDIKDRDCFGINIYDELRYIQQQKLCRTIKENKIDINSDQAYNIYANDIDSERYANDFAREWIREVVYYVMGQDHLLTAYNPLEEDHAVNKEVI